MLNIKTKSALREFAPHYSTLDDRNAKLHQLKGARAALLDTMGEGVETLTDRDFHRVKDAIDDLADAISRKTSEQAIVARTARPVAGQDGRVGMSEWGGTSALKDASGNAIKAYRHNEPLASQSMAGVDYGIGDIVKASITGDWSRLPSTAKGMSSGIGPAGGFLVPAELAAFFVDLARAKARVLEAGALTIPMPAGNMTIATVTADPAPGWKAENAKFAVGQGAYGAIVMAAHTLGVIVPLSLELVMSATNVNTIVGAQLQKAMALALDTAAISGDGTQNTVKGIINSSGIGDVVIGASLLASNAYPSFGGAIGKCLAANADLENLSVLYNSDVSTAFDRLIDSLGQPLQPSPNFASIANRNAVYIANGIPTSGSPAASYAIVGDFSQVLIGMQQNLTLEISREGSYVDSDGVQGNAFGQGQVLLRAYMMVDVAVQRPQFFSTVSDIHIG